MHKYEVKIEFVSEKPMDEHCFEQVREAIRVASSHIMHPRWCGHISVRTTGINSLGEAKE